jgi:hypothetical protein
VWTRRQTFKAGAAFVFENTAAEASDPRDFHVTIDWACVADPALCAVPKPSALPLEGRRPTVDLKLTPNLFQNKFGDNFLMELFDPLNRLVVWKR